MSPPEPKLSPTGSPHSRPHSMGPDRRAPKDLRGVLHYCLGPLSLLLDSTLGQTVRSVLDRGDRPAWTASRTSAQMRWLRTSSFTNS